MSRRLNDECRICGVRTCVGALANRGGLATISPAPKAGGSSQRLHMRRGTIKRLNRSAAEPAPPVKPCDRRTRVDGRVARANPATRPDGQTIK